MSTNTHCCHPMAAQILLYKKPDNGGTCPHLLDELSNHYAKSLGQAPEIRY